MSCIDISPHFDWTMKLALVALVVLARSVCSEEVKRFLPNTNFGTPGNWKEAHVPCPGGEIIFPRTTPKIFLDGAGRTYQLSRVVLPESGELILDNAVTWTAAAFTEDSRDCHASESHYSKEEPDFWYNPHNWCSAANMTSPCSQKPPVEASLVPSSVDFVVFPSPNSIFVAVKPTEPTISAGKIYYRRKIYTNSIPFRLKIQRTSRNKRVEFVKIGSNSPPLFELKSAQSKKAYQFKNSNLEKMEVICKYVSCAHADCPARIQPRGACCPLCGHLLQVELQEKGDNAQLFRLVSDILADKQQSSIMFDLLWTDQKALQITLAPSAGGIRDLDTAALEIANEISLRARSMGVGRVSCSSCNSSISRAGHSRVYIIFLALLVLIIVVIIAAVLLKRFRSDLFEKVSVTLPVLPTFHLPTINWNCFHNSFSRTRLSDRMDDSLVEPAGISSIFTDGIEAIELPDASHEVSFDNPIFSPQIDDTKH